ncbi:MAG: ABC transporter ATP-binding protein [Actinobacteria bacterium]|nr:ABC transporter ATP-binding protein [Actinomycetota bacterium]
MPPDASWVAGQPATSAPRQVPELTVSGVTKTYRGRDRSIVVAVDDVSFSISPGAAVSLVGASGSGKSTLARLVTGSERPTSGAITFGELAVGNLRAGRQRALHRQVQMVFQDPYGALNPLHTVEYTVLRPIQNFLGMPAADARQRVRDLLETVGLSPAGQFAAKLPHQLSGGQRQRVVIARALACDPALIVADEPVSMLDVSLRAGVLSLLAELRRDRGLSLLYITHDLLSARAITDEVLVLHAGRIVERGATSQVLRHPRDHYTIQLLEAVPNPFVRPGTNSPSRSAS